VDVKYRWKVGWLHLMTWSLDLRSVRVVCELQQSIVTYHSTVLILLSSGKVYKGTWQKVEVALKVMETDSGIVPSSEVS